ncbi:MAG: hypothetical protein ACRER8_08510 [Pseudomonas sp.]|uniref:hypothetical protein n=1 Tax=Pseudomonas sp. TaxID=306 RepID=UPI003D6ECA71
MFNLTRELFFSNELADIDARLASGDSLQNATASKPTATGIVARRDFDTRNIPGADCVTVLFADSSIHQSQSTGTGYANR